MAAERHLGFGKTGNSAIRFADLKNHTVEPNMKWIGRTLAEISPFEIFQNVRSVGRRSLVVGRSYIYFFFHLSHILLRLLFATLGTHRARSKNWITITSQMSEDS